MLSDIVESGCAVGRTSIESGRVGGASYPGVFASTKPVRIRREVGRLSASRESQARREVESRKKPDSKYLRTGAE